MSSPSMMSPQPVIRETSPAPLSPKPESQGEDHQQSPGSPPALLATMTPVNVMELQKDFEESQKNELYQHQERELYYTDRTLSPAHMYQQHDDQSSSGDVYEEKQPQPQIDLIYEDGKQTVIYTTSADQKALEIYSQSSATGELVAPMDGTGSLMTTGPDGTPVSVVVQGGLHYPQQTGTTVLVLSELVDGMQHVDAQRRRRDSPGSPIGDGDEYTSGALVVGGGGGQNHQTRYYEHPLTSTSGTMLNLGGQPQQQLQQHDDSSPPGGQSFVYEYYKLPDPKDMGQHATVYMSVPTTKSSSANAANGSPPIEMATGLSSHEIQGLLLGPSSATGSNGIGIKREPEDLSHKRHGKTATTGRLQQKILVVTSSNGAQDLVVDVDDQHHQQQIKEELSRIHSPPSPGSPSQHQHQVQQHSTDPNNTDIKSPAMFSTQQVFMSGSQHGSGTPSPVPYTDQYGQSLGQNYVAQIRPGSSTAFVSDAYYRDYFPAASEQYSSSLRQAASQYNGGGGEPCGPAEGGAFPISERYRQAPYKGVLAGGLTVDLPSPDSGIGADAATPRDQNAIQQSFDYTELCQPAGLLDGVVPVHRGGTPGGPHSPGGTPLHGQAPLAAQASRSRPWHDFGRQNDADKIQIPKIFSSCGFKYHLESPISSSQRREDDRITYINKGQFYGISLEYIHDPEQPLKSQTVKSVVMLMFREEKSPEDEIKAWQFWHGRQHSVKQRILDADTKNSVGLVGCIEEVSHNAIAVYWNPLESGAKINVAVQCLSTDFSSQKGVKGLPLHLQIDTFEDPRDPTVFHRGYCQIKVFCDKGAERKTRDEERRAAKRKMTATGRKKLDELYHPVVERSEFYSMSDLNKPPVLFSPAEDIDKLTSMELQGFYGHENSEGASLGAGDMKGTSPFLLHTPKPPTTPTLKFHNHFPPDTSVDKKTVDMLDQGMSSDFTPPMIKRSRLSPPPLNERVMLYVRQEAEDVYTPLHVVPPTTQGLLNAIENKYKISASSINNIYRKNMKGITAKIDNEMLSYYCNEDLFLLEVRRCEDDLLDITLVELPNH